MNITELSCFLANIINICMVAPAFVLIQGLQLKGWIVPHFKLHFILSSFFIIHIEYYIRLKNNMFIFKTISLIGENPADIGLHLHTLSC